MNIIIWGFRSLKFGSVTFNCICTQAGVKFVELDHVFTRVEIALFTVIVQVAQNLC